MSDNDLAFLGREQMQHFPHLQQWLSLTAADTVELGHIVEAPTICSATSIVPLGWSGSLGEKNGEPFKVDITGFGLHLCTFVHAQVNGTWYGTFHLILYTLDFPCWTFFLDLSIHLLFLGRSCFSIKSIESKDYHEMQ